MNKLVVGCGYLGLRVARRWLAEGHAVAAVTRDAQRAEELCREGLQAIVADVCRFRSLSGTLQVPPDSRFRSPSGTSQIPLGERDLLTVLYAVGYDRRSGQSRREVYVEGLRNVLDALPAPPERFIFISSTGVYGNDDGGWVDEDSPCNPTRESGRALLAAEQLLQSHAMGRRAIILRLAGIYGPGRLRHEADLRAGRSIAAPAAGYLNLIHVDDAASVILAAETLAVPPRTYVVSDGHPVERREFLICLAESLGAPPPRCVERTGTGAVSERGSCIDETAKSETGPVPVRSRAVGLGKRVNNARMMRELGVRLAYPTYQEGLEQQEKG